MDSISVPAVLRDYQRYGRNRIIEQNLIFDIMMSAYDWSSAKQPPATSAKGQQTNDLTNVLSPPIEVASHWRTCCQLDGELLESKSHCLFSMYSSRIEQTHAGVLFVYQHADFCASLYHCFSASLFQCVNNVKKYLARFGARYAKTELFINHSMNQFSARRRWNQHVNTALLKPPFIKMLFHREPGAQQANALDLGINDPCRRRVGQIRR